MRKGAVSDVGISVPGFMGTSGRASAREAGLPELVMAAVEALSDKNGHDIVALDLRHLEHAVCDYFVICHGTSTPQVRALADAVEARVAQTTGEDSGHSCGRETSQWILLDYFDVMVHIFEESRRRFYDLEGLWADARITHFAEDGEWRMAHRDGCDLERRRDNER